LANLAPGSRGKLEVRALITGASLGAVLVPPHQIPEYEEEGDVTAELRLGDVDRPVHVSVEAGYATIATAMNLPVILAKAAAPLIAAALGVSQILP
jgi:hypothetical protein